MWRYHICAATVFSLNELAHECKKSTSDWRTSLKNSLCSGQCTLWTNTTRTSGLNFRQLPVGNGSAFPEVPKQTRQPREVNPNFSKLFSKWFSFHSAMFLELTGSWGESKKDSKGKVNGWRRSMYVWVALSLNKKKVNTCQANSFTWFASLADEAPRLQI